MADAIKAHVIQQKLRYLLLMLVAAIAIGIYGSLFGAPWAGAAVSDVSLFDSDYDGHGLDGRDFTIDWSVSGDEPNGFVGYSIFILSPATAGSVTASNILTDGCSGLPCTTLGFVNQYETQSFTLSRTTLKDSEDNDLSEGNQYIAAVLTMDAVSANNVLTQAAVSFSPTADTVADAEAPRIEHVPVHSGSNGTDAIIHALINDAQTTHDEFDNTGDGGSEFFTLYYGDDVSLSETQVQGVAIQGSSGASALFRFTIPSSAVPSLGAAVGGTVEYYLGARDKDGNTIFFCADPNADSASICRQDPFIISFDEPGSRQVSGVTVERLPGQAASVHGGVYVYPAGYAKNGVVSVSDIGAADEAEYTLTGFPDNTGFELTGFIPGFCPSERHVTVTTADVADLNVEVSLSDCLTDGDPAYVVRSNPVEGGRDVQASSPIWVSFTVPLDPATVFDADASSVSDNVYMVNQGLQTVAGQVVYCQETADPGCGVIPSGEQNVLLFEPTNALAFDELYSLVIGTGVKSADGVPVSGNGGGQIAHTISFSTQASHFSDHSEFTDNFGSGGQYLPPFVRSVLPATGGVWPANGDILIEFNETMDPGSIDENTIKLFNGQGVEIPIVSVALDISERRFVTLDPGTLAEGEFEVRVLGGAANAQGIPMRIGNVGSEVAFSSFFVSNGETDSTAPTIYPFTDTGDVVDADHGIFEFGFDEPIDPSTVTGANITMQRGRDLVTTVVEYDPGTNSVFVIPSEALAPNTRYTIAFNTSVTDLAGNAFDTEQQYRYTTQGIDTSAPRLLRARCDDFSCFVEFSEQMEHGNAFSADFDSSVLNTDNIALTVEGSNTDHVILGTNLIYNAREKALEIEGLQLIDADTFTLTVGAAVTDLSGNAIDTADNANSYSDLIEDSSNTFGAFGDHGMFGPPMAAGTGASGGIGGHFQPQGFGNFTASQFLFNQAATAFPHNTLQAADSSVFELSFNPTDVDTGDSLAIVFPNGTDVSNAAMDTLSAFADDLNGFHPGSVTVSDLVVDEDRNTVWLTLAASNLPDSANQPEEEEEEEEQQQGNSCSYDNINDEVTCNNQLTGVNCTFDPETSFYSCDSVITQGDICVYDPVSEAVLACGPGQQQASPGITIDNDPLSGLVGEVNTIDISFSTEPSAAVTVAATLCNAADGFVSFDVTNEFTLADPANNWETLFGIDLSLDAELANQVDCVTLTTISADPDYNNLSVSADLEVTLPPPGVVFDNSEVTGNVGDTPALSFYLTTQPTDDVIVTAQLCPAAAGNASFIGDNFITLSNTEWSQDHVVEVPLPTIDMSLDGEFSEVGCLTFSTSSLDPNYDGLNDSADITVLTVQPEALYDNGDLSGAVGGTDLLNFSLTTQPTDDVTITAQLCGAASGNVSFVGNNFVTLTTNTWAPEHAPPTIEISYDAEMALEPDCLTFSVGSFDPIYDLFPIPSAQVEVLADGGGGGGGPEVIVEPGGGVQGNVGDVFNMYFYLTEAPTDDVIITVNECGNALGNVSYVGNNFVTLTPTVWGQNDARPSVDISLDNEMGFEGSCFTFSVGSNDPNYDLIAVPEEDLQIDAGGGGGGFAPAATLSDNGVDALADHTITFAPAGGDIPPAGQFELVFNNFQNNDGVDYTDFDISVNFGSQTIDSVPGAFTYGVDTTNFPNVMVTLSDNVGINQDELVIVTVGVGATVDHIGDAQLTNPGVSGESFIDVNTYDQFGGPLESGQASVLIEDGGGGGGGAQVVLDNGISITDDVGAIVDLEFYLTEAPTDDVTITVSECGNAFGNMSYVGNNFTTITPFAWAQGQTTPVQISLDAEMANEFGCLTYSVGSFDPNYDLFAIVSSDLEITAPAGPGLTLDNGDFINGIQSFGETLRLHLETQPTDDVIVTANLCGNATGNVSFIGDNFITIDQNTWSFDDLFSIPTMELSMDNVMGFEPACLSFTTGSNDPNYNGLLLEVDLQVDPDPFAAADTGFRLAMAQDTYQDAGSVHIDLTGIVNPPVPRGPSTGGYTVTIRQMNSSGQVVEEVTSMPYFITASGSNSITVNVHAGSTNGIAGADGTVYLSADGPAGPMDRTITMADGVTFSAEPGAHLGETITFEDLPDGCYFFSTDSYVTLGGEDYFGLHVPETECVDENNSEGTVSMTLTPASGGGGATSAAVTVKLVGTDGNPFDFGGADLDIFAGGSGNHVSRTLSNLNTAAANGYTLRLRGNGNHFVGVGPSIGRGSNTGIPPQLPAVPPPPIDLTVTNDTTVTAGFFQPQGAAFDDDTDTVTFTFATADKCVTGIVVDGSQTGLQNVEVALHALGFGAPTFTTTDSNGEFTLCVSEFGSYEISAFRHGLQPSRDIVEVRPDGSVSASDGTADIIFHGAEATIVGGANPVALVINRGSYTISGKVLDAEGDGISGASVSATDANGRFVSGQSDNDGSYTLSVNNGTWSITAHYPSAATDTCGRLFRTTIVNGEDKTGQNIEPGASICYTLSGTVSFGGSNLANSPICIDEWDTNNDRPVTGGIFRCAQTDSDGVYTFDVPENKTLLIHMHHPTYGRITRTQVMGSTDVLNADLTVGATGTITFSFTEGISSMDAFIFVEHSSDPMVHRGLSVTGLDESSTMTLQEGTYNYFVDVFGVGRYTGTVATGETATIDLSNSSLLTLSGTVTDSDGSTIAGARVTAFNESTAVVRTAQTDANGAWSLSLAAGTYTVSMSADGYIPGQAPVEVSLSDNTAQYDFGGSDPDQAAPVRASYTITGIVYESDGSTVMSEGRVSAVNTDGLVVIGEINGADGTYTLSVNNGTWTVTGRGPRHAPTSLASAVTIDGANSGSNNITLTADATRTPRSASRSVAANSGGTVDDSGNSGITLSAGAGVLDNGDGDVTVRLARGWNAPDSATRFALADASFDITAQGDTTIYDLNGNVQITISYADLIAQLPEGVSESELQLAYLLNGEWIPVEGGYTVDVDGDQITGFVPHLTTFGIVHGSGGGGGSSSSGGSSSGGGGGSSSGGSAAGPSPPKATFDQSHSFVATEQTTQTYNMDVGQSVQVRLGGAQHTVTVVSASDNQATVTVESDPITATLTRGTITDIDTNRDAIHDLRLVYDGLRNGRARLLITSLGDLGELRNVVTINAGSYTTDSRTVTLSLNADNVVQMGISNNADFADSSFIPYSPTHVWQLTEGNGDKTVYVRFRSAQGGILDASDTIALTGQAFDDSVGPGCPLSEGGLYRSPTHAGVYRVTLDCTKRPFRNANVFFSYFSHWEDVVVVPQIVLDRIEDDLYAFIPWGPNYQPRSGTIAKVITDPRVYAIIGDKRHVFASEGILTALGYAWQWVEDVVEDVLDRYEDGEAISTNLPLYSFMKHPGSDTIYRIEEDPNDPTRKIKRPILSDSAFDAFGFRRERVVEIPDLGVYEVGDPIE